MNRCALIDHVRVVAPHFVAGLDVRVETGKVVAAAPILKWTIGWERHTLSRWFRRKGWVATIIQRVADAPDPAHARMSGLDID